MSALAVLVILLALEIYAAVKFDHPPRFKELMRYPGQQEARRQWKAKYENIPIEMTLPQPKAGSTTSANNTH